MLHEREAKRENKPEFNYKEVLGRYQTAYNEGYRDGRKTFDTRTVKDFQIGNGNITQERYGSVNLFARVEYSNGTKATLSEEVTWSSDKPSVADVPKGKAVAQLVGVGDAKISAKFVSGGQTFDRAIKVTVTSLAGLQIRLLIKGRHNNTSLDGLSVAVREELQFTAYTATVDEVPASEITWSSGEPSVVKIDPDSGKAVALKGGDAQIFVTEREFSLRAQPSMWIHVNP